MNNTERRAIIDSLWATVGPPELHADEAVRAFKKLVRFIGGSAGDDISIRGGKCWGMMQQPDGRVELNPKQGWQRFVSCIAWWAYDGADKEKTELKMVREIIKRGWIGGRLRDPPKTPPTKKEKIGHKLKAVIKRQESWERKRVRAVNALKKLKVKRRYYEKQTAK